MVKTISKNTDQNKKSIGRFQQINHVADKIAPSLKTPSMVAIMMVAVRHSDLEGVFTLSTERFANCCRLSKPQVTRLLRYLTREGVLFTQRKALGKLPPSRRITGQVISQTLQVKDP